MTSFYEFCEILEDYKNIDPEKEYERMLAMNMTASLPIGDVSKGISGLTADLTRGFHLNTIMQRMVQPWILGLQRAAPLRYDLAQASGNPEDLYKYQISEKNPLGNNQFKAAFFLFKQELANALHAVPDKTAFDIVQQKEVDALEKAKAYFQGFTPEEKDMIQSLRDALNIYMNVFGNKASANQIRNFENFIEIVKDEFFIIPEKMPTMAQKTSEDFANAPYVKLLDQEQKRLRQLEDDVQK